MESTFGIQVLVGWSLLFIDDETERPVDRTESAKEFQLLIGALSLDDALH